MCERFAVYDPCCGTGGFLAQTYELLAHKLGDAPASTDLELLSTGTFYGREAQAKADAIDAAVYDLKAVNPRVRVETDTRTAAQIIESIEQHGLVVDAALKKLKALLEP